MKHALLKMSHEQGPDLETMFRHKNWAQKVKIWKSFLMKMKVIASKHNLPVVEARENRMPVMSNFVKKIQ